MFCHSLLNILVDREKSFAGAPIHLTDELATEGVNDTSNGGSGPLADEVEVEHALHGSRLHTTASDVSQDRDLLLATIFDESWLDEYIAIKNLLYKTSGLVVKEGRGEGREGTTRRVETGNVVVRRFHAVVGGRERSRGHDESEG